MDADEQDIYNYLKAWPRQFISVREISRRAGGKKRFSEDPYWANQVVLRMVEKGILETDQTNHYRLKVEEQEVKRKKWVSPQIQKILEQSGKDFSDVISPEEEHKGETPGGGPNPERA